MVYIFILSVFLVTLTMASLFNAHALMVFLAFLLLQNVGKFVCLLVLRLNVPVSNFSNVGTEPLLPVYYQCFRGVKCLAQVQNKTEIGFGPRPVVPESDALPLSHPTPQRR